MSELNLPISVVIPTRNSMALLPAHVEMMRPWLDRVEEVIVVDSESTDGTVEFLQRSRLHPRVKFLSHPPGLYESWNHAIAESGARYTYISAVGDGISRNGLIHLVEVAEDQSSDVVISPPKFVHESGVQKKRRRGWPVHTIIKHARLEEPASFEGVLLFLLVVGLIPHAILGSSSSNLYRTSTIQRYPFPVNFGHHGDGAWAAGYALNIRLGVTPREVSHFRLHRHSYTLPYREPELELHMIELALAHLRSEIDARPDFKIEVARWDAERFLTQFKEAKYWRTELRKHRARSRFWMFNPQAVWAKIRQSATQRECDRLMESLMVPRNGRDQEQIPE
ncbi:MAG: glycosyltransferase [Verrucomicrobiales bacterium]